MGLSANRMIHCVIRGTSHICLDCCRFKTNNRNHRGKIPTSICAEHLKSLLNRAGARWNSLTGGGPQHTLSALTGNECYSVLWSITAGWASCCQCHPCVRNTLCFNFRFKKLEFSHPYPHTRIYSMTISVVLHIFFTQNFKTLVKPGFVVIIESPRLRWVEVINWRHCMCQLIQCNPVSR